MNTRSCIFIAMLFGAVACTRQEPTADLTTGDAAGNMSELAATPEQKELWQAAASRDARLGGVAVATQPVQVRAPAAAAEGAAQTQPATAPAEAPNAARVLQAPAELRDGTFRGAARIVGVQGDRVEFDLGPNGRLSAVLRVKAAALQAKEGENAQIELRRRDDPRDRAEVLAVRTAGGQRVVSVLEGDTKPVSVTVALFQLTARQVGEASGGAMPVEVTVAGERRTLTQGQTADFPRAGLTVGIIASQAVTGDIANREEGNPYAIRLLAWPTN